MSNGRFANLRQNFRTGAAVNQAVKEEQTEALKQIEEVQKQSGQTEARPIVNATISIYSLKNNPYQYLQRDDAAETTDDDDFVALLNSIRDYGYQGGIIITRNGEDYFIIQGHRRAKALRYLADNEGYDPVVPVVLVDLSQEQMIGFLVTSNSTSKPVSPLKIATTINYFQNQRGLSVRDIVRATGMSKKKVENYIILGKMPASVKTAVEKGEMSLNQVLDMHSQNVHQTKSGPDTLDNSSLAEATNQKTAQSLTKAAQQTRILKGIARNLNMALAQLEDVDAAIPEEWAENLLHLTQQIEQKIKKLSSFEQ